MPPGRLAHHQLSLKQEICTTLTKHMFVAPDVLIFVPTVRSMFWTYGHVLQANL